jgi:HPt (histidine-containing phosphotransfer) domain-containing protein
MYCCVATGITKLKVMIDQQKKEWYDLGLLEEMQDNQYLLLVLSIFLRDTAADLKEIEVALAAGDISAVGRKAHKMKGSAGVIQAAFFLDLLNQLEDAAKKNINIGELSSIVKQTQKHYRQLDRSLVKIIQQKK